MLWSEKPFQELTGGEVFSLMRLRSEVFVVEQNCVYPDLDDKDAQSNHLFACDEGAVPGAAARAVVRLVPPGVSYEEPSIGRVAIDLASRGSGLGEALMMRAIRACYRTWPGFGIRISAQQYLIGFYERLGFSAVGEGYLEDDIPHIQMFRPWDGLAAWQTRHKAAVQAFADHLRALPLSALQGTESQWGGLQVLEHLMRSEHGTWSYLSKKGQANPAELPVCDVESDARGIQLVHALESDARWMDPTPGGLLSPSPGGHVDMDRAVDDWLKAIDAGYNRLGAVYSDSAWWKVQVFKHPIAGRLGLTDTLAFGVAHVRHHVHQLRRLTETAP